jgi:hypothetical protein
MRNTGLAAVRAVRVTKRVAREELECAQPEGPASRLCFDLSLLVSPPLVSPPLVQEDAMTDPSPPAEAYVTVTREKVEQALEEWQRETEQMSDALAGAFELSDEVATTQLK